MPIFNRRNVKNNEQEKPATALIPSIPLTDYGYWKEFYEDILYYSKVSFDQIRRSWSYLYPHEWRSTKELSAREIAILDQQQREKQKYRNFRNQVLERRMKIKDLYDEDIIFINRKRTIAQNWYQAAKERLKFKQSVDENIFVNPDTENIQEIPGWNPKKSDLNAFSKELCDSLQCYDLKSVPEFSADSRVDFEQQMKMRQMYDTNLKYQSKLTSIESELEKCVRYLNDNQESEQPMKPLLEIGSGDNNMEASYSNSHRVDSNSKSHLHDSDYYNSFPFEGKTFLNGLQSFLAFPIDVLIGEISLTRKKRRKWLITKFVIPIAQLIAGIVIAWIYWKTFNMIFSILHHLLDSALSYLPKKREQYDGEPFPRRSKKGKTRRKKRDEEEPESEDFWNQRLGWLSNVIHIKRGGALVPINKINIYDFNDNDRQQILNAATPEIYLVKMERNRQELENLLVQVRSETTLTKNLVNKLYSFISKTKTFILNDQTKATLFGLLIFLSSDNLVSTSMKSEAKFPHFLKQDRKVVSVLDNPFENQDLQEKQVSIGSNQIQSTINNESTKLKHFSQTKKRRLKKAAKTVTLSDLPALQNVDESCSEILEIQSRPNCFPIRIKINKSYQNK
jgi:hypothetical protein